MPARSRFAAVAALALLAGPAFAVDHNNLDSGRPLRVEDAESIAFREQALEVGLTGVLPRRSALGLGAHLEYLYGAALNTHLSLGLEPSFGGRAGTGETRPDFGDVSLGVFHNFNRETLGRPAFAIRGDVVLPSGRGSKGTGFRLRGIASRHVDQYGRLHVNLDLHGNPGAGRGERDFHPALTVGYSRPLGYPTRFDRTLVAELGVAAGPDRGTGPVATAGVGLRQQIGRRSVLDLGVQADFAGSRGAPRDRLRLILGISSAF